MVNITDNLYTKQGNWDLKSAVSNQERVIMVRVRYIQLKNEQNICKVVNCKHSNVKKLINSDLEKNQEIEYLKLQIQELQKSNAPATCSELVKQGIARSQDIFLDSDGLNSGEKPVKAFCDFANNITKVGADNVISIKQCGSPKCFREEIQYENSVDQLVTLAEKSDNCYQQVTFDCLSSPLEVKYFEFS